PGVFHVLQYYNMPEKIGSHAACCQTKQAAHDHARERAAGDYEEGLFPIHRISGLIVWTRLVYYKSFHFPIQNWLKMESRRSSVVVLPTISPTALVAMRRSIAASSR